MHVGRSSGHITHTHTHTQTSHTTSTEYKYTRTHTPQLGIVLQLSEVEMKFLLAHFIVVPIIIFIVPPSKGMTADGASSCKELLKNNSTNEYYDIQTRDGVKNMYCDMEYENCGREKGWTRIAYINISDPNNSCSELGLTHTFARSIDERIPEKDVCTRSRTKPEERGCSSVKFSTHGIPYTKVCGRARGYQSRFTRAFHSSAYAGQNKTSDSYVSGLSVTRGKPRHRKHIWTFAAGFSKAYGFATVNCPHALYPSPKPPYFVKEDYFCDSGNPNNSRDRWYLYYALWDSKWCEERMKSKWCKDGVPWFTKNVGDGKEVTDDIEVRMCHWPPYTMIEDIGVDELEIYIKLE